MGNSQTKQARLPLSRSTSQVNDGAGQSVSRVDSGNEGGPSENNIGPAYQPRPRRGSRPDLSFLGLGGFNDQDVSSLEARRESKQEREARKAEKERTARIKEREHSMREENVDGGYLVTQGVYVGVEDFNKSIVRQLMIERRLAPFWQGLNDFSESWAEHQLMAAARGLPIPPADQVPPELEYTVPPKQPSEESRSSIKKALNLTVPISSRSQSYNSESSPNSSLAIPTFSLPSASPLTSTSPTTAPPLFRTRAKTLASLTPTSKNNSESDVTPRELQLPADPFVNGQPIEAYLYKDASECPICFLYYPPYLNTTRCCDQPICSECFVQIKRPEPHPPEHEQADPNAPPVSVAERESQADGQLVSEVATCPFCKQPEFGITYVPPSFRRGLTYSSGSQPYQIRSAMSSETSVTSGMSGFGRRRGTSLSANAPEVVTSDKIRPDWATKLATARAYAARRSAAATALHTAAYLMNGQQDSRVFGPFGRRTLRRPTLEVGDGTANAQMNALAILAERHAAARQQEISDRAGLPPNQFLPPPRGSSSRRSRMDDLEDMMMMEAIRLSLASEEERRKKEEKEEKKNAKKKDKAAKKAEKAGRKNSLFSTSSGPSNMESTESRPQNRVRSISNASSMMTDDGGSSGKGKAVDRNGTPPFALSTIKNPTNASASKNPTINSFSSTSQESLPLPSPLLPIPSEPVRRSHLRQMSNASSSTSSLIDPTSSLAFAGSSTPQSGGAGTEPMFNFRSLAAMIGDEEKGDGSQTTHLENAEPAPHTNPFEDPEDEAESSSPTDTTSSSQHEENGHTDGRSESSQPIDKAPFRVVDEETRVHHPIV